MKTLVLALSLIVSTSAFASSPKKSVPDNSVFDQIETQARQYDFFGYDVLACFYPGSDAIALGGVSFWNSPLQVYVQNNYTGSTSPAKRVSDSDEVENINFKLGARGFTLTLGQASLTPNKLGPARILAYKNASLKYADVASPVALACYLRNSGLE